VYESDDDDRELDEDEDGVEDDDEDQSHEDDGVLSESPHAKAKRRMIARMIRNVMAPIQ
jgi:hypothetical protein